MSTQEYYHDSFKVFLLDYCGEGHYLDEEGDDFYELRDWVVSDFKSGIPSSSVQRRIDKLIKHWLSRQSLPEGFLENLFDMSPTELAFPSALALCRHLASVAKINEEVEPEFKGKEIEAFVLVERVLTKGYEPAMDSVFFKLNETLDQAFSLSRISMVPAVLRLGAWNALITLLASVQYYYKKELKFLEFSRDFTGSVGHYSLNVCGNETSCNVIRNSLPEFNFEDLLRWEYFNSL